MDERLEDCLSNTIKLLKQDRPELLEAVMKHKYFITTVMVYDNPIIIIDCNLKTDLNMSWREFKETSEELYDSFARVEHWYKA